MIRKINIFFNDNPLIGILIVIFLVFIIMYCIQHITSKCPSKCPIEYLSKEHLSNITPVVTHPAVMTTNPTVMTTHPAVTNPAVTNPAVTHPAVTHPAVMTTHPAITHSAVTNPAITHPAVTHPSVNLNNKMSKCDINTDNKFNMGFIGHGKTVNFKCTYDGIEYYLANMEMTKCKNRQSNDCTLNVIVLIPVTEITQMLNEYLKSIRVNTEKCNSNKRIDCLAALSENSSEEQKNKCMITHKSCDINRFYYHDFHVSPVTQSNPDNELTKRRSYVITGNANPDRTENITHTMLNQMLYYDYNINMLCGDHYNYKKQNSNTDYVELVVIETSPPENGGIIGAKSDSLKVKLRFTTKDQMINKEKDGKITIVQIKDNIGNNKIKSIYIGICPNKTSCKLQNGKSYPRVCLYDDIFNTNVLEFEPILVNIQ